MLPTDLTSLPGVPICGQGSLSWPQALIKPRFLLRPPTGFLPQPAHPTGRPLPGLPLPNISGVQVRPPPPGETREPWLPFPEVSLPVLLLGPNADLLQPGLMAWGLLAHFSESVASQ